MEGPLGFEPRTHSLKGCRSNQLSYGPVLRHRVLLQRMHSLQKNMSQNSIIKPEKRHEVNLGQPHMHSLIPLMLK